MARLRRAYFDNIGVPDARFMDLTLPFTGADDQPADSLVLLKNGGGKSALLSLLFTVVQPALRQFLGQKDDKVRSLSDYVQRDDHGVVALEWEIDTPARSDGAVVRLLTGVFLERKAASAARGDSGTENEGPVERVYFSYYTDPNQPSTALDALPLFTDATKRFRYASAGFEARLEELASGTPHAQVFTTHEQKGWLELLASRGLDPEVFAYQIRMNQREGGAKDLFASCSTVEDYLDLFLEVLIDRRFGDNIRENLAAHRDALFRRKTQLVPGRGLADALLTALEPIRTISEARTAVRSQGRDVATRVHALTDYGLRRLLHLRETARSLAAMRDEAQQDLERRQAEAASARQRAARRQRDIALVTLRDARDYHRIITERHAELTKQSVGWQIALPLRDARHHEAAARRHREDLAGRERQHAPLLDRLRDLARSYLGALVSHGDALATLADDRAATIAQLEIEEAAALRRETEESTTEAARLADARAADERDAIVRLDWERLVRERVVLREEVTPTAASLRLAQDARDADTTLDEATRRVRLAEEDVLVRKRDTATAIADHQRASEQLALARQTLERAEHHAQRIAGLPHLGRVLELAEVDATQLGADAISQLRQAARRAYEDALAARARHAAALRDSEALRDTGLLPCSTDVALVLRALQSAISHAHAGWRYLADAMTPAQASALVDRAPDIALGVVVRDADYDAAVTCLRREPPTVTAPVRIVRQSDVDRPVAASGYVVRPTTDAHFDRDAGRVALGRVAAQLTALDADVQRIEVEHGDLQATATSLDDFLQQYTRTWFVHQRAEVEHLVARTDATAVAAEHARVALEDAESAAREAEERKETARRAVERIQRAQGEVSAFRQRHGDDLNVYRDAARRARENAVAAHDRAAAAAADAAGVHVRVVNERLVATDIDRQRTTLSVEMNRVEYVQRPVPPQPGNRLSLASEYQDVKDRYDRKIDSHGLLALAAGAEHEAQAKRAEVRSRSGKQKHGWDEDSVGALLDTLQDPSDAQAELDRIDAQRSSLFAENGNHGKVVNAAEEALRAAQKTCTDTGIALSASEESAYLGTLPADPDQSHRAAWRQEYEAALSAAQTADGDAEAVQETRTTADRDFLSTRAAEALVQGGMDLLHAAEVQQGGFLHQFGIDAAAVAVHQPATDEGFRAAIDPWTTDRSALLDKWRALDERRDRASRSMVQLLTGLDVRLVDPFLSRIRDAEPALLEEHVETLLTDVTDRRDQMALAIADVDIHRDELVSLTLLAGEEGRRLLRQLRARASVPQRVEKFGGSPFLKIDGLNAADPAAERAAAEALVDALTTGDTPIPTALTLIQQAVRALTPEIAMTVLYPKPERPTIDFWPITRLGKMSGGEGLTIATLLYCTLARVRGIARGETGTARGVLLFDNPFGTASSATFVTLQREVAREFGVQLIYFTGILDLEAIRLLPNRLRLGTDHRDRARGYMLVELHDGDPLVEALREMDATQAKPVDTVQLIADEARYLYGDWNVPPTAAGSLDPSTVGQYKPIAGASIDGAQFLTSDQAVPVANDNPLPSQPGKKRRGVKNNANGNHAAGTAKFRRPPSTGPST